jgi:hypothetical protein
VGVSVRAALVAVLLAATPTIVHAAPRRTEVAGPRTIEGRVRRSGERQPVDEARVLVVPEPTTRGTGPVPARDHIAPDSAPPRWTRTATTDENGDYVVEDVPAERARVIVLAPGYVRAETTIDVAAMRDRPLALFLDPQPGDPFRTVVESESEEEPGRVTTRELSREEIATLPGTQGDPLRALQNFPGVARTPGGLGLLILRGAAPSHSRVFFGEHALPRAFHALAISSVVPADVIERLHFLPGNAPARYGDLTGGAIVIDPRRLRRDGFHGHAEIDLLAAGALVQGPVGKGAFLVAAQRGYVDAVLQAVEAADPTQAYLLPRYYDYQGMFEYPTGPGATIGVRLLGAGDRILTRSLVALGERQLAFELDSQFHRADLVYRKRVSGWNFVITPSFRLEQSRLYQPMVGDAKRTDSIFSWRIEASRRISKRTRVVVGTDGEIDPFTVSATQGAAGAVGLEVGPTERTKQKGLQTSTGAYLMADITLGPVSFQPGLRVAGYTVDSGAWAAVDPRLAMRWQISDRWAFRSGVGLYTQPSVPQYGRDAGLSSELTEYVAGRVILPAGIQALEPRAGFSPALEQIDLAHAVQASAGVAYEPTDLYALELGGYLRARDNGSAIARVEPSPELGPWTYFLDYGMEVLARRRLAKGFYGWLSYTLGRSRLHYIDALGGSDTPRSGVLDQRHVLALIASYELPRRWRIGGRFRVVSGTPYTPVIGAAVVPGSQFAIPVFGPANSQRFPVFHQLDLRVDKRWVLHRVTIAAYVDVQNVYNRVNVEAYIYDYYYRERINAIGLPIFPSLGFRIDF